MAGSTSVRYQYFDSLWTLEYVNVTTPPTYSFLSDFTISYMKRSGSNLKATFGPEWGYVNNVWNIGSIFPFNTSIMTSAITSLSWTARIIILIQNSILRYTHSNLRCVGSWLSGRILLTRPTQTQTTQSKGTYMSVLTGRLPFLGPLLSLTI